MIFRFLLSLFLVSSVFGQAPGNQSLTLSTLNFKGLEKISSDQAVGASKLTLKSKINLTHLDDAAKSLVEPLQECFLLPRPPFRGELVKIHAAG
jgi:hypothetical protein